MKRLILLMAVMALFGFVFTACDGSGEEDDSTETTVEETTTTTVVSLAPDVGNYEVPIPIEVTTPQGEEKLFPIGWSQDGAFAYMTLIDEAEAVGPVIDFHVVIQNMISDKILWEMEVDEDPFTFVDLNVFPNGEYIGYDMLMEKLWELYEDEIQTELNDYGIAPVAQNMKDFPIKTDAGELDYEIIDQTTTNTGMFDVLRTFKVQIGGEDIGSKIVYKFDDEKSFIVDVDMVGYFKNPYEARAALVMLETYPGWEGVNSYGFQLIGSHLEKGYE